MADLTNAQGSTPVEIISESSGNTVAVNADGSLNVTGSFSSTMTADQATGFRPDPSSYIDGTANLLVDSEQQLVTRGTVHTDEQSFRDDFSGSSLTTTLTGTLTFVNGSTAVTGSGTTFTTGVKAGQYIRASAHANSVLAQVESIQSDTALTLASAYTGANATSTAVRSNWKIAIGTGAAQSVASSVLTMGAGTTSGAVNSIVRLGDYLPYTLGIRLSLSQRIISQEFIVGFVDTAPASALVAAFQFNGATNTTVNCIVRSSSGASDLSSLTVTLPGGGTTATTHKYDIDLSAENATFLIDGIVVAKLEDHIPGPYDVLQVAAYWNNTGIPATNTNALVDSVYFANVNIVDVTNRFAGIPTNMSLPVGTPVLKTGTLVTTAVTADQVVLTYTVTSRKNFYMQYLQMDGYVTTLPGNANPIRLGAMSLETPSGTKAFTVDRFHVPFGGAPFPMNVPIPGGTVVRVVVTPAAATSYTWRANIGGYEI